MVTHSASQSRSVGTRVLVVDDDADYRLAMRWVLEKQGYEVHEAENGQLALDLCRSLSPSIILLDVIMPVMSGAEFLNVKQADSKITFIPVVVVSTSDLRIGARVVRQLRKPVDPDVLISIIRLVVGASRRGST